MEELESILLTIPYELLLFILSHVSPIDLIRNVSTVSRGCEQILRDENLWQYFFSKVPVSFASYDLCLNQLQRCCTIMDFWKDKARDCYNAKEAAGGIFRPIPLLPSRELALDLSWNAKYEVCLASSTDHHFESIHNVLMTGNEIKYGIKCYSELHGQKYWSSKERSSGKPGKYDEDLLFTTLCTDALISEIVIQPDTERLLDFGNDGVSEKTYNWRRLKFSVYRLTTGLHGLNDRTKATNASCYSCFISSSSYVEDYNNLKDREKIDFLLQYHRPIFESPVYDVKNQKDKSWQVYQLPLGVVGNVIKISLIGKSIRQYETSGFYACVRRVSVNGFPLYNNNN